MSSTTSTSRGAASTPTEIVVKRNRPSQAEIQDQVQPEDSVSCVGDRESESSRVKRHQRRNQQQRALENSNRSDTRSVNGQALLYSEAVSGQPRCRSEPYVEKVNPPTPSPMPGAYGDRPVARSVNGQARSYAEAVSGQPKRRVERTWNRSPSPDDSDEDLSFYPLGASYCSSRSSRHVPRRAPSTVSTAYVEPRRRLVESVYQSPPRRSAPSTHQTPPRRRPAAPEEDNYRTPPRRRRPTAPEEDTHQTPPRRRPTAPEEDSHRSSSESSTATDSRERTCRLNQQSARHDTPFLAHGRDRVRTEQPARTDRHASHGSLPTEMPVYSAAPPSDYHRDVPLKRPPRMERARTERPARTDGRDRREHVPSAPQYFPRAQPSRRESDEGRYYRRQHDDYYEPRAPPAMQQWEGPMAQLISAMQAPKIVPKRFAGDPLTYAPFIRSLEDNVEATVKDPAQRLQHLLTLCDGEALRLIQHCDTLHHQDGYAIARGKLYNKYGDSCLIAEHWVSKLLEGKTFSLRPFADELRACLETLEANGYLSEIDNNPNLKRLAGRLPDYLRRRFQGEANRLKKGRYPRRARFSDFVRFVENAAEETEDPVFGDQDPPSKPRVERDNKTSSSRQHPSDRRYATNKPRVANAYGTTPEGVCPVCSQDHVVVKCPELRALKPQERVHAVAKAALCFICLKPGHRSRNCTSDYVCKTDNCRRKHATMLHGVDWRLFANRNRSEPSSPARSSPAPSESGSVQASNGLIQAGPGRLALPIVHVKITDPDTGNSVETSALLDTGSTRCFCAPGLLKQLGIKGTPEHLKVRSFGANTKYIAKKASLLVSQVDGDGEIEIPAVYTSLGPLPVGDNCGSSSVDCEGWKHLKGLPIHKAVSSEVSLLIGMDCPDATAPLNVVLGKRGEPYAVRTRLGWTLNGPMDSKPSGVSACVACTTSAEAPSAQPSKQDKPRHSPGRKSPRQRRRTAHSSVKDITSKAWDQPIGPNLKYRKAAWGQPIGPRIKTNTAPVDPKSKGLPAAHLPATRCQRGPESLKPSSGRPETPRVHSPAKTRPSSTSKPTASVPVSSPGVGVTRGLRPPPARVARGRSTMNAAAETFRSAASSPDTNRPPAQEQASHCFWIQRPQLVAP